MSRRRWIVVIVAVLLVGLGYAGYRAFTRDPLAGLYHLHPTSVSRKIFKPQFASDQIEERIFEFRGDSIQQSRAYLESHLVEGKWRSRDKDDIYEYFADSDDAGGPDVSWFLIDNGTPTAKVIERKAPSKTGKWWDALMQRIHPPQSVTSTSSVVSVSIPPVKISRPTEDLIYAVMEKDFAKVKKAVAAGAKVNAVGKYGDAPLLDAFSQKDLTIAKYLLSHGGGPNASYNGDTLVSIVGGRGYPESVKFLLQNGARVIPNDPGPLLSCARQESPIDDMEFMVDDGDPWFFRYNWENADKVAEIFLDNGAPVDGREKVTKQTPLHKAAECGHLRLVQVLLAHGANPSLKDSDGSTARDIVIKNKRNQWRAIVPLLDAAVAKQQEEEGRRKVIGIYQQMAKDALKK